MKSLNIHVVSLTKLEQAAAIAAVELILEKCGADLAVRDRARYELLISVRIKLRRLYFDQSENAIASS